MNYLTNIYGFQFSMNNWDRNWKILRKFLDIKENGLRLIHMYKKQKQMYMVNTKLYYFLNGYKKLLKYIIWSCDISFSCQFIKENWQENLENIKKYVLKI